jgi:ATP-binding cassette, subfamily G (WHITE), member 2
VQVEFFISHCLTVILGILNAQSLGLLVGALTRTYDQALTLSTVLLLAFMLCAGFFIQAVPAFLGWVK